MKDYVNTARKIFEGTKYEASENYVRRLADNMSILEERGLGGLNKRLIDARKHDKIFETIAEHNFAMILVSKHCSEIPISYEPATTLQRPPDFKVEMENITYWIQMKRLSKLERENRQEKIIQQIKKEAKKIKIGKFFSCALSDDFKENCLSGLINFIKDKAASAVEEKKIIFAGENNQKVEITFWSAKNIALSELTLGYAGDLEILEITGLDMDQIRESLLNAAGAFTWESDRKNINLIAIEADNKEDMDICDALFGAEYEIFHKGIRSWTRKNDGLFGNDDFSRKVAGVIAIKRKRERDEEIASLSPEEAASRLSPEASEYAKYRGMTPERIKKALEWRTPGPIADYSSILYMNDRFKDFLVGIEKLIDTERAIYFNMRTPMGQGNFE